MIDRERGEIPPFVRIVIETSGLADPGPSCKRFRPTARWERNSSWKPCVTVVDTATGLDTIGWSSESRKQVILADRIILSKTDLADPDALGPLRTRLRELNSHAEFVVAENGQVDPRCLTESGGDRERSGFIAEAEHSDGIASFVIAEQQPMKWDMFSRSMETLIALRGSDVLRVKGFLAVEGCRGPVLVQFVQHLAHPPVELAAWPDGERTTRLVFITRGITEGNVRGLFRAVEALTRHSSTTSAQ